VPRRAEHGSLANLSLYPSYELAGGSQRGKQRSSANSCTGAFEHQSAKAEVWTAIAETCSLTIGKKRARC